MRSRFRRLSSNSNSLRNSFPSELSLARHKQVLCSPYSRSNVSKCRLKYLMLSSSRFLNSGCSGYLKHPRFQLSRPCSSFCCAQSLRMVNFENFETRLFDVLRIKNLEHWVFCRLHLSHGCGSNLILLSTSTILAGRNRLVWLYVKHTFEMEKSVFIPTHGEDDQYRRLWTCQCDTGPLRTVHRRCNASW